MTIISRGIKAIRPQRGGTVQATGTLLSTKGRSYQFRYNFIPSDRAAVDAFNAAKTDWDGADRAHRKVIQKFRNGGATAAQVETARLVVDALNPALSVAIAALVVASKPEAEAELDARDLTEQLKKDETDDFTSHLEGGGLVQDFTFVELTRADAKEIVRGFFAMERDELIVRKAQLDAIITEVRV